MIQVWTNDVKGDDKLIGVGNNTIYKANPKTMEETEGLARKMRVGDYDTTKVWDIKTNRCSEIRLQEGKSIIEIFCGKQVVEDLRITDEYLRYKIFDVLKENSPGAECKTEKWTFFQAGKKPIIAFIIVAGLFTWTMYYVIQAQKGYVYYNENGSYFSLTGIVLMIASLGLTKVLVVFCSLLAISILSFIKKINKLPVMNRIIIKNE